MLRTCRPPLWRARGCCGGRFNGAFEYSRRLQLHLLAQGRQQGTYTGGTSAHHKGVRELLSDLHCTTRASRRTRHGDDGWEQDADKARRDAIGVGKLLFLTTMASNEDDEVPRLWKVNRTIHELVKDRVREDKSVRRDNVAYTLCRASKSRTMKST